MLAPLFLVLISVAGNVAALFLPDGSDLLLLSGPATFASLYLLVRAFLLRPRPVRWILVDGSNVLHWKDGRPQIGVLREVVDRLAALGFTPAVVFDANAGHRITGRYLNEVELAQLLALPPGQVTVVARGTQADPALLAAARDLNARIVTNDRYRDWAKPHPEVLKPGHLVRGGYREKGLWLDVSKAS